MSDHLVGRHVIGGGNGVKDEGPVVSRVSDVKSRAIRCNARRNVETDGSGSPSLVHVRNGGTESGLADDKIRGGVVRCRDRIEKKHPVITRIGHHQGRSSHANPLRNKHLLGRTVPTALACEIVRPHDDSGSFPTTDWADVIKKNSPVLSIRHNQGGARGANRLR